MPPKASGRKKLVRVRARKGAAKNRQNMKVVWCLVGMLVAGFLFALSQTGEEPVKQTRRPQPRTVAPRPEAKELPVTLTEEVQPELEPETDPEPSSMPETEPQPDETPSEPGLGMPEPAETANEPGVEPDDDNEDEPEEEQSRDDKLNATSQSGEYYIDMETRSLLFTDDASLNDENLEIYLEETYKETESERYDEEAAERPDENKQVK